MTTKRAVIYARVSSEEQAKGEAVSIDGQLSDMRALAARNGWQIDGEFIDCEDYRATQDPKRGKMVNPSGERSDRPRLLALLEEVRGGSVDLVLCWRDDRLVRHPRVAVVLEDALDLGDTRRNGAGKVRICDATGADLDRFTMSIKAAVWREENKRRAERVRMGKTGTLKDGRWPGEYIRLGYATVKEPGRRGVAIALAGADEVATVERIYEWYDAGHTMRAIREKLIAAGHAQKGRKSRHPWNEAIISDILSAEDYTGRAVWRFADGAGFDIKIPAIIPRPLWERVKKRRQANVKLSTRNASGVYLLQGLLHCGACDSLVSPSLINYHYKRMLDGTMKRYDKPNPQFQYRCVIQAKHVCPGHPAPSNWPGEFLDWRIWRGVVDQGIKHPELILEQVRARQAALQAQHNNFDGEIAKALRKLAAIDQERATYQRQNGRGKMTDAEYDTLMDETKAAQEYWNGEIARLRELRDDAAKIKSGIDYAHKLLTGLQNDLPAIDQAPEELRAMPQAQRERILRRRQTIVRALVDKVTVWPDGRLRVEGLIDGSEGEQFGVVVPWTDLPKLLYLLELGQVAEDGALFESVGAQVKV